MAKFRYKVLREFIHVQQYFDGIALEWRDLPPRFFKSLHGALAERLNIQASELSANPSSRLSEVYARYNVYGGSSAVTLFADRIAFDFPGITGSDLPLIYEIMGAVHDNFPAAFPELKFGRAEVQDLCHFDLGSQDQVSAFFERFVFQSVSDSFKDYPSQITFGPKFQVVSEDGRFRSSAFVESSALSSTAIFGSINSTLAMTEGSKPFLEKAQFMQSLTQRCLNGLDLEIDNVTS
ncbi:hypothetical protein [Bradyrhizobium sp. 17]|uniref:hypothetical protein n=1 Tax=Bradyrhizobium sp. 17 TaxID=2782649 RepID=UPI001FF759F8|nr:hypothetical protein [Bradyrhizobium sp. 17]MCK1523044.1 hypothetical protein [Bradyrhizobium sp. 17]